MPDCQYPQSAGVDPDRQVRTITTVEQCLYILTGYTAVGKTGFSLDWAERHSAEIVSCDSLLFYRGMNIGTAKPTQAELSRAPHHLVDVSDVSRQYSIDRYVRAVRRVVDEIHGRGNRALVVGGSGFYLNAFFRPMVDHIKISSELRAEITRQFESQSLKESVEELRRMNPDELGELDLSNPRRVLNAWIRCRASGLSLVKLKSRFVEQPGIFENFSKRLLILSRPLEQLEERLLDRVHQMLRNGLVEEVENLVKGGIAQNPSAAQSIGYRETLAYLRGELDEEELPLLIAQNTRRLIKKQRTWFKKFLPTEAVFDMSNGPPPDDWFVVGG